MSGPCGVLWSLYHLYHSSYSSLFWRRFQPSIAPPAYRLTQLLFAMRPGDGSLGAETKLYVIWAICLQRPPKHHETSWNNFGKWWFMLDWKHWKHWKHWKSQIVWSFLIVFDLFGFVLISQSWGSGQVHSSPLSQVPARKNLQRVLFTSWALRWRLFVCGSSCWTQGTFHCHEAHNTR